MPYRDSSHHELEIPMRFNFLNLFKPNEQAEDYHIRKPNGKNFRFEIEDEKYIYVGENIVSFETNDKILNYFSEFGFNDVTYAFSNSGEDIYFMLHQKKFPVQE